MNINLLLSPQTDANWLVRCPFLYPLVSVILEKASQAGLRPVARKKFVRPAEWSAVLNWASKDLRQTVSAFYQRVVFELCDKQCRYASLTTTIQRTVRSICKSDHSQQVCSPNDALGRVRLCLVLIFTATILFSRGAIKLIRPSSLCSRWGETTTRSLNKERETRAGQAKRTSDTKRP